jgi:glycosyltransferase involved in cell wall biosynthesis
LKIVHDEATREALVAHDARKAAALRLLAPAWNAADRRAWRRYRHVFANSEETRRRVVAARLRPSGELEVLRPGVDTTRFTIGSVRRGDFLLTAGRIMWQKNIELSIDTLARLRARGATTRLVVAGAVDEKSKEYLSALRARAAELGVSGQVEFVVSPSDEELIELYRDCLLLLFTARNEDFGIVPLEAMACGAPVLAVDRGGPRETVVDGRTGWLRNPDPDAFADVVAPLVAEPHTVDPLRVAAVARATEFSWSSFVARIDDVMERIAAS